MRIVKVQGKIWYLIRGSQEKLFLEAPRLYFRLFYYRSNRVAMPVASEKDCSIRVPQSFAIYKPLVRR